MLDPFQSTFRFLTGLVCFKKFPSGMGKTACQMYIGIAFYSGFVSLISICLQIPFKINEKIPLHVPMPVSDWYS